MAVLNDWQKLSRVGVGNFGDGSDGNATISSDINSRASASGSSGGTSLTIGSAILSNGDVFMIHQTRGTGHGQWEINKVASGGGTTSITCSENLQYTYGTGAQVVKIPMYDTVTLGSYKVTNYNLTTGGIVFICAKTSISGSGTITARGGDSTGVGGTSTSSGGIGAGFQGGDAFKSAGPVQQGDGHPGAGGNSTSANGQGGGGGTNSNQHGGGGGHANSGGSAATAVGGSSVGSADLTSMEFGGGGGGGCSNNTSGTERSGGGGGGGIVVLCSPSVDVSSASILLDGGDSDINSGGFWNGGGGAGGSGLVICQTATLGSNRINATGGVGRGTAPDGSNGRIAVHYSDWVTGTTTPSATEVQDASLAAQVSGAIFFGTNF